jgi:hypothetical protein
LLIPDIGNTTVNGFEWILQAGFSVTFISATGTEYIGGSDAEVGIPGRTPGKVDIKSG